MGAETHYRFQYGTESCAEPGSVLPGSARDGLACGGARFGLRQHDRVAARHGPGSRNHVPRAGDRRIQLRRSQARRSRGRSPAKNARSLPSPKTVEAALPDGRAWEQVSPPLKHGSSIEPTARETPGLIQAAVRRQGDHVRDHGAARRKRTGRLPRTRGCRRSTRHARRAAGRRRTSLPATSTATGARLGLPREYGFFSSQLDERPRAASGRLSARRNGDGTATVYRAHGLPVRTAAGRRRLLRTAGNQGKRHRPQHASAETWKSSVARPTCSMS